MNFSVGEGDAWDSTPTQDLFIQKYFAKKESLDEVVSKRERKRKKQHASNVASTSIQSDKVQNKISSKKLKLKNSNKIPKLSSSTIFESISSESNKKTSKNNNNAVTNLSKSCEKTSMLKFSKTESSHSNISQKFHLAENNSNKGSIIDNNTAKKINLKKKRLKISETPQNNKESSFSKDDKNNINSNSSSKVENNDIQSRQQKLKKRKLNMDKISQNLNAEKEISKTSVQNFIITSESKDLDDEFLSNEFQCQNKKKFKTKNTSEPNGSSDSEDGDLQKELRKPKTKKAKTNKLSQIKEKSPVNETKFKTKKLKSTKNILNAKECLENDSEKDNDIRNELQNSRMFLKIQKLMKMAPHLNPSYCEDSEENAENSSCHEISSEYSSSESEGEYSSKDDNEALTKDDEGESAADLSDNSFNNDQKDSSDSQESSENEEKNIEYSESNQITSKQIEQIPDVENHGSTTKKPNTFMDKARSKLAAAKFRFLNEKLYTETGEEAYRYFQDNKEEFEDYHLGYRQQVSKWPLNPVDEILKDLQKLKKGAVIADLGCGEAKIARVLSNRTVHSFDLVAKHKCVTACDFSKVPLKDSTVDVAVFCLSLMGVNLVDYLHEAYRMIKIGGTLKIAEVESRIEDLDLFIENLETMGFVLERKNTKNKLFVFLDLKKVKKKKASKAATISLRPCMYKKR